MIVEQHLIFVIIHIRFYFVTFLCVFKRTQDFYDCLIIIYKMYL